jgi:catechol 2,3-dioxygenase-like lactoylglutathione lyase family enzyme
MSEAKQNLHITALHEFYFPVTDASSSAAWYQRHFGLQHVSSSAGRETLQLDEGALLTLVNSKQLNRYDSVPIQFKAHDANKAYLMLDKSEVRAQEPEKWHHYIDFDVKDPDGNKINIISDPAWPNTLNNFFRIDGVFISVVDFERAFEWYADVLGAEVEYDFTHPSELLPAARNRCFRGIPVSLVESPVATNHYRVCDFRTSNILADYAYLREHGVRVSDLSETNGRTEFVFYDLDGREFGLVNGLGN